jgi:hypothetical protein
MATTTPNYGWTVPTSTDLVKDGATAIETLGDAIDASMNTALGTKKAGMVLLNTTSFSGVSSQSINSVFSSTYTNYKILINADASAQVNLIMRYRTGTTDNTAASYKWGAFVKYLGAATLASESQSVTDTSQPIAYNTTRFAVETNLYDPFSSKITTHNSWNASTDQYDYRFGGLFNNTTSFDGFTFYTSGVSTMTGTVSVYGYNK